MLTPEHLLTKFANWNGPRMDDMQGTCLCMLPRGTCSTHVRGDLWMTLAKKVVAAFLRARSALQVGPCCTQCFGASTP